MGRRRGSRPFAAPRVGAGLLGCAALVLAVAGCGTKEHANEPRSQPPTRVSVIVTEDAVEVQPRRIAAGPEPTQRIPQNREAAQPQADSDRPLDVVLVAANLTDVDSRLELRGDNTEAGSEALVANGNISLLTRLETGVYTLHAADIPGAEPARLTVGPYRTSSENDLLLP